MECYAISQNLLSSGVLTFLQKINDLVLSDKGLVHDWMGRGQEQRLGVNGINLRQY
jgi:hypothetical protein